MAATPVVAAALAGIPAGIQRQGLWLGRRQLFVRFAGPAETAQMYTADALASNGPLHPALVAAMQGDPRAV